MGSPKNAAIRSEPHPREIAPTANENLMLGLTSQLVVKFDEPSAGPRAKLRPPAHHFRRISFRKRSHESPDFARVSKYVPTSRISLPCTARKSETAVAASPSTVITKFVAKSVPR